MPEQGEAFLALANRAEGRIERLLIDPQGAVPLAGRCGELADVATPVEGPPPVDLRNVSLDGIPERIYQEELSSAPDHVAQFLFAGHWAPGRRVVDVCCGVGYGTNLLAAAGASHVVGVDVSPEAVAYAVERFGGHSISFVCHDATRGLPVAPAELTVCFEGLEHVEDDDGLLGAIADRLDPKGLAIVSTPNGAYFPGGFSGNPYHVREYTRDELERALARRFGCVTLFAQWADERKGAARDAEDSSAASPAYRLRPIPAEHAHGEEPLIWIALCRAPIPRA